MMDAGSPTVRRRRLASELHRYREAAGLSAEEAASKLGWSRSKISRIEAAVSKRLPVKDVTAMLDAYGITDEAEREAMLRLAREARQRGWWTTYGDVLKGALVGFEAEAKEIRTFEPLLIPGLLQTPQYAHAVFRAIEPEGQPDELERRVAARMTRTLLLERDEPPRFWAILDEAALRRPIGGPSVMAGQLDRLVQAASQPHVQVQVVPFKAGGHPGIFGPFVLLDFPTDADQPLVLIETGTDGLYLEKPVEIEFYRQRFEHLLARALGPDESAAYIGEVRASLA